MNILITGSHGQLGNELQRCLSDMRAEIGPVPADYFGAHVDAVDADVLDITDAQAIDAWFDENGPYDLVINCAAMTNVDGCETSEDLASTAKDLQTLRQPVRGRGGRSSRCQPTMYSLAMKRESAWRKISLLR